MKTHNNLGFSYLEVIANKRGYKITKDGIFYGPTGKKLIKNNKGYSYASIQINGGNKSVYAHRLQAYQKYGEDIYNEGMLVRHLDGDKTNNSYDNIAIGTNRDNMMDVPKEIRVKRARTAGYATIKYNHKEVYDFWINNNNSRKKTMKYFNISSTGTLHYIINKCRKE